MPPAPEQRCYPAAAAAAAVISEPLSYTPADVRAGARRQIGPGADAPTPIAENIRPGTFTLPGRREHFTV